MRKFSVQDLTLAALLAAVYATLTLVLPIPAFTGIQIRMSEALTVLPFLFPAATPGLFVGCIVANLFSPYPLDIVCGSAATLLACLMTQRMPSRWLAPLPPVLCNAAIVGAEIAWFETGFGPGFWPAYAFNALTVGLGELLACYFWAACCSAPCPASPSSAPSFRPTAWTGWPPTPESASALTAPDGWTPGASGPGLSGSFFISTSSFIYLPLILLYNGITQWRSAKPPFYF